MTEQPTDTRPLVQRLAHLLDSNSTDHWLKRRINGFMAVLIIANVVAVALETLPGVGDRYMSAFWTFELVSVAIFSIEYLLRLWVCPHFVRYQDMPPGQARWRYARTPMAIVDLLAILPFYLSAFLNLDLRLLRAVRLLRLFKIMRYSVAIETLIAAIKRESQALYASFILMVFMLVVSASAIYYLEHEAQPEAFQSIPHAMWWAMATLSTVGYGDLAPITPLGKFLGALVMIIGIGMFALPTGILASGFTQELKRREFLATWHMVARVPLFEQLSATEIAEIMDLLEVHHAVPNETIVRAGEEADHMYFIVDGHVEVHSKGGPVVLNRGDFFGEVALILGGSRRATVSALSHTELLRLQRVDLEHLMMKNQGLAQHLRQCAQTREDAVLLSD